MKSRILSPVRKQTPTRRRLLQALGFACLAASAALPARAQTAYTWDGGTGNWSDGSMWGPMTVPNDPSADVFVDGGKTSVNSVVNVDGNFTIGRLTVDAGDTVNINDNQSLTVQTGSFTGSGSIIDNGTINVNSGGNDGTTLAFTNGAASLSGTGTLNMINSAFVYASSGNLLTVGAGFTITGMGQLGDGSTTFLNNGTINANSNGNVLDLRPGGGTAVFTNGTAGLAEATGGGTLYLDGNNGGTFSGGTFQALTGSTVNILNGTTVSNATLTTAGSGVINLENGSTLNNVTSNGAINVPDNASGTLEGTFTNSGTLTVASAGNDGTALLLNGPVVLAGTGTINMTNSAFLYAQTSGSLLTIGAGVTIEGQGQLGNGSTTFLNNGLVNANSSGAILDLRPGGGTAVFTNGTAGLAEATGGGTLYLDGGSSGTFTGGTFQALTGSTVNILNGTTVSSATLTTAGSGVINLENGSTLNNVTSTGTINVPDNTSGTLEGTFTNSSTLTIASGGNDGTALLLNGPVVLAGTGTINLTNSAFLYAQTSGSLLTIGAGVTIEGQGQLGNGSTTFLNNGTVNANVGGNVLDLRPSAPGGTSAAFINQGAGLAEATGGGILYLDGYNGGTFSGGTFQALAGSTVNILNGTTVSNATLTTAGSGVINLFGSSTLSNVTSTGTINVPDDDTGTLAGTFTSSSTLTIASGGNDGTTLLLNGPVILAGTGTINMTNNAFLYAETSGSLLTIGAGVTIEGQNQLGNGSTTFLNNGTVNANVGGATLDLRPSGPGTASASFINQGAGLAEATGGGTLDLDGYNGGTFSGGTFQALTGSTVNILNGTTVSNATLTTAGSGVINLFGNSTLSNVTSTGIINVPDNNTGVLANTFTNTGTLTVASGGNDGTALLLNGPVVLAGTGTINLTNNAFLYAETSGSLLTIGAGVTIEGQGQLGNGSTTFLNNGTVNANIGGNVLDLRPGGGTATFTNQGAGLAEATAGGTLNLDGGSGGTFTGGTFQALAGSTVNILNGTTVSSATLTTAGSGVINLFGSSTLSNVTSTGTINVPDDDTGTLAGTFTSSSTLTIASGGNDGTTLLLNGPVILAGTGTINMTNNAFLYAETSGSLLTIGAGVTIEGQNQLGNGSTTFLNNGTVNANVGGAPLDLRPGGGTATFTNGTTGLAEATAGGTLHLDGGSGGTFTNNGTFEALSGSTGGSSTLTVDAGTLTNYAGTTLTGGTYKVIATDASATSTLSLGGGTITTNAANVVLSGANTVFTEIAPLAANQGSFTVANGRNFTTVGALANTGTLVSAGGSTLTVTGPLTQTSAGTLTGNGAYTAAAFTLSGNINPGGTVSATTGAYTTGAGTTTLNGDASFDVNTKFNFELGAMTGTNDHLNITGALNLNGTLNVAALAGFGTGTYDLIDFKPLSLTGSGLTLGTLPAGFLYVILYLPGSPGVGGVGSVPGSVDLVVTQAAVPEPGTWAFVLGGGALLLGAHRLRRRTGHGG